MRFLFHAFILLLLAAPCSAAPSKTNPDHQNLYIGGIFDSGDIEGQGCTDPAHLAFGGLLLDARLLVPVAGQFQSVFRPGL